MVLVIKYKIKTTGSWLKIFLSSLENGPFNENWPIGCTRSSFTTKCPKINVNRFSKSLNNQLSESVLISHVQTQIFIEGPFQNGQ